MMLSRATQRVAIPGLRRFVTSGRGPSADAGRRWGKAMLAAGLGGGGLLFGGHYALAALPGAKEGEERNTVVFSWGNGLFGQLGNGGQTEAVWEPTAVERLLSEDVVEIAAAYHSTAVVTAGGEVFTFGCGSDARLGHGWAIDLPNDTTPRKIEGLGGIRHIAVGGKHMAAIDEGGALWTWGAPHFGQLGHKNAEKGRPNRIDPSAFDGQRVAQVSCGYQHTVCVTEDGDVYAWGMGRSGALGLADKRNRDTPTKVGGIADVEMVSCGGSFTMALTRDGRLYAWGDDAYGNLGQGQLVKYQRVPKPVQGLEGCRVAHIAAGEYHALAVTEEGALYTWGNGNEGQTGHGDRSDHPVPTAVDALRDSPVLLAAAGGGHSAVIGLDGTVFAFGRGRNGQLGRGNALESVGSNRRTPVPVTPLAGSHVVSLALGSDHTVAMVQRSPEDERKAQAKQQEKVRREVATQGAEARAKVVMEKRRERERAERARREQLAREHAAARRRS